MNCQEYFCLADLNLYDSSKCQTLATQAAAGRHLKLLSTQGSAIQVCLCEDGYLAWLAKDDLDKLKPVSSPYQPVQLTRRQIEALIPDIIAFTQAAMRQPNYYLWGGTVGPNYDCSGLIQAAFSASGVWLPRDSYQQAEFTSSVELSDLRPGDLIFFAAEHKVNHVALYRGNEQYIHSSGREYGRNGIGIDWLSSQAEGVGRTYYQQFLGCGRVMSSYVAATALNKC